MQEKETTTDELELDPLDRDAAEHDAFAQSRFSVYIGRDEYFDRLNEHATSDGPPLVILGESGSGKSALLANWADEYRSVYPDGHLIIHFIGSTPYSADWAVMLRRIMGEFKRRFDIEQDIPTEPDQLRSAFTNWLHMVSAKGRIVLILDALNQLEDKDNALDLTWLPPVIPENVRLILSTLPGRSLDELIKREWPSLAIEPLSRDGRNELTVEYLNHYGRSLSAERLERIVGSEQTHNPLFLRTLLDELDVYKEDRHLERAIDHYLSSESIPELFERVIKRLEQDYEREWPGLVEDALVCIWASRRGLAEEELFSLLGTGDDPFPETQWALFCKSIEHLLVSRSGLLAFFHDYMRQAIQDRYLQDVEKQKTARLLLADYFGKQELNPRKVNELPWQLSEAEEWKRLYDLLGDLEFFKQAFLENEFEVKRYWAKVEGSSQLHLVDAYKPVLDAPDEFPDSDSLTYLGRLLHDTGCPLEALSLLRFLAVRFRQFDDLRNLANCLRHQGVILYQRGDFDEAMTLYQEVESIFRDLGDTASLPGPLINRGLILKIRGDLVGAMMLYKEAECISREFGLLRALPASLGNQGLIHWQSNDLDNAMSLFREQERIGREHGYLSSLLISLVNQGLVLIDYGDLDGAMAQFEEAERISLELGDQHTRQFTLGHRGRVLFKRGDMDAALSLYDEQERISREIGDPQSLLHCLINKGDLLQKRGDLDSAMALYKEVESISRNIDWPYALLISLIKQGWILKEQGDLDGAMAHLQEGERICREIGERAELANALIKQGEILKVRENVDGAMELLKEGEGICREIGDPSGLSHSLTHQADVLLRKNKPAKALPLAEEAYEIAAKQELAEETENSKAILDKIRAELGKAD